MIKRLVKKVFFAAAPETATILQSARARSHSQKLVKQWGLFNINEKLRIALGSRVLSGPFQGLILTPMTFQEHIGPYLLGTYEAELQPWFEKMQSCRFEQIIDVGTKFGYYAIGLARMFPETEVLAFDTDWWARKATLEMAKANRVNRVSIRGYCSPRILKNHIRDNALILSDCEGYEGELFCKTIAQALTTATMIIEMHEDVSPGVTSKIQERFAQTHNISRIASSAVSMLPANASRPIEVSEEDFLRASKEIRPGQEWALFTPKATSKG